MISLSKTAPFVIVESPYAGDIDTNTTYARACVRDSILRGEAPFASHLLYTQPGVLRDQIQEERELGMGLGWHVMNRANYVVVYTDRGWSSGMVRGCQAAFNVCKPIELRRLGEPWSGLHATGLDYARISGHGIPARNVPLDTASLVICENGEPSSRSFIEIDLVRYYAVVYTNETGVVQIEVINFKPGQFSIHRQEHA